MFCFYVYGCVYILGLCFYVFMFCFLFMFCFDLNVIDFLVYYCVYPLHCLLVYVINFFYFNFDVHIYITSSYNIYLDVTYL